MQRENKSFLMFSLFELHRGREGDSAEFSWGGKFDLPIKKFRQFSNQNQNPDLLEVVEIW